MLQEDLERAIKRGLCTRGRYVAEFEAAGAQGAIDAQWAAHRAGRSLGMRVQVTVREKPASSGRATAVLNVMPRIAAAIGMTPDSTPPKQCR